MEIKKYAYLNRRMWSQKQERPIILNEAFYFKLLLFYLQSLIFKT